MEQTWLNSDMRLVSTGGEWAAFRWDGGGQYEAPNPATQILSGTNLTCMPVPALKKAKKISELKMLRV